MRLLLAAAIAASLAIVGPADAAQHSKPCARTGSHTVKSTKRVRVYDVKNHDGGKNLYGCLRSDNRRQLLAHGYDDNYTTSGTYAHVKINGHLVSWTFTSVDDSCKADCPPGYDPTSTASYVRDLKKRKTSTES
jgi:hypothetical protein